MNQTKILAIDFDHTICDTGHPVPGRHMGPAMDGAKEALTEFMHAGYKIIIFTIWTPERHKILTDWLTYYEIPYDEITNIKPKADAYIDDKAIRFEGSWPEVQSQILPQD